MCNLTSVHADADTASVMDDDLLSTVHYFHTHHRHVQQVLVVPHYHGGIDYNDNDITLHNSY